MDWVHVIRESRDQSLLDGFPGLIAAFHALHRLLAPRHPPYALSSLTTMIFVSRGSLPYHQSSLPCSLTRKAALPADNSTPPRRLLQHRVATTLWCNTPCS
jgi:hypothetical protein